MKKFLSILSLLVLVILSWSCTYKTTDGSQPTTELIIIDTSATEISSHVPKLLSYENSQYGFAFTYPDTWTLSQQEGDGASSNSFIRLEQPGVRLTIEYGLLSEIQALENINKPTGKLYNQTPVNFLGESLLSSEILVNGKVKFVVFPDFSNVILVKDMFFHLTLQPAEEVADAEVDFESYLIDEVYGIVESFSSIERTSTLVDSYSDWQTYLSLDYGLLLRYPPEWQLEETGWETIPGLFEDALSLTKDKTRLLIGYHFASEYVPHTEGFQGGLLTDKAAIPFVNTKLPKLVLQYDGKDKAVYYDNLTGIESGGLVFSIRLMDTTSGAGYDLVEVGDDVQKEAEGILAAFHQFSPALSAPEETIISQGKQYFLTFDTCFDLDQGVPKSDDDTGCDFSMEHVYGSNNQKASFQPLNQAVYDFTSGLADLPTSSECAASEELNMVKKTELTLNETYICYQTSVGRYGSLILRGMTSDGVSFDWQTSSTVGESNHASVLGSGEYDMAVTVRDMTIPDGTVMKPGEEFTKTWQLLNKGTSTWTTDYAIRFESGDRLGTPYEVAIPSEVRPGGAVNVSVDMIAPMEPGEYNGNWVMRNSDGHRFGMGEDGSKTFWVQIVVEEE